MNIDPVTVVVAPLREAASTMEHALYHSGYSPIPPNEGRYVGPDRQGRPRRVLSGGINSTTATSNRCRRCWRYPVGALRNLTALPAAAYSAKRRTRRTVRDPPAFHRGERRLRRRLAHKSDIGGIVPGSGAAAERSITIGSSATGAVPRAGDRGIDEANYRFQQPRCRCRSAICGRRSVPASYESCALRRIRHETVPR